MDKLEPVACVDCGVLNFYADTEVPSDCDLYALPSTHRIVSVELLEACMRECYMPEDNLRDRIGEIIDQE